MFNSHKKLEAKVTYVCILRFPLAMGVGPPVAIKMGHPVASVAAKHAVLRYAGRCLIALEFKYEGVAHRK